eukprot:CAMPEP_0177330864 /NCGR_PEP_ID=MMETSP0368-20130122/20753_1 /TAXON_ID=447022 ORGANISM="Scrippsiella hangoei-like, Strain SHHI-4" /NCGR_SAMPLE_ID=MMETSP0368 /ASSEMBLY_ACC=CAM_ASM_000363 /LENGTH=72 /DNA_ID=CAMNT_0018791225 /DNA_START=24 /DNA_END=239 /DNA_ORIENTATION=-
MDSSARGDMPGTQGPNVFQRTSADARPTPRTPPTTQRLLWRTANVAAAAASAFSSPATMEDNSESSQCMWHA